MTTRKIIVLMFGVIFLMYTLAYFENKDWEKFKAAHECKFVHKNPDTTQYMPNSDGTMTPYTQSGTEYWNCKGTMYEH